MITNYDDVEVQKAKKRCETCEEKAYAELGKIKGKEPDELKTAKRVRRSVKIVSEKGRPCAPEVGALDCRAKLQALNAGFLYEWGIVRIRTHKFLFSQTEAYMVLLVICQCTLEPTEIKSVKSSKMFDTDDFDREAHFAATIVRRTIVWHRDLDLALCRRGRRQAG